MGFLLRIKDKEFILSNPAAIRDTLFKYTLDIEISINAENWCELNKVGETYIGRNFTITSIT